MLRLLKLSLLLLATVFTMAQEVQINWNNPVLNRHVVTTSTYNISSPQITYNCGSYTSHKVPIKKVYGSTAYMYPQLAYTNKDNAIQVSGNSITVLNSSKCTHCDGKGYIESDGSLYSGTFVVNPQESGCCNYNTGYHDECDEETYGEVYHHLHYIVCPYCHGTGRADGRGRSILPKGWSTTDATAWTHTYIDADGDGHCDEHYWHTPIGEIPILFFILLGITYLCFKNKADIQKLKKYVIKPFIY